MTVGLEYGQPGLLGVLTPQANTTVEPELWALLPPGWSMLNARLTSDKRTIPDRLVDYTGKFSSTAAQFANAPVDVIAAACTGASYLIGIEKERRIVTDMEAAHGVPFLTAALASVAALRVMNAKRIALLSPYPASLNEVCAPYWEGHGFDVVAVMGPALDETAFHPIYAMAGDAVLGSYRRLSNTDADAVLMLGTGMATLQPLLTGFAEGLKPALSCNLALVWAAAQKRSCDRLEDAGLSAWRAGGHWQQRYRALFPET